LQILPRVHSFNTFIYNLFGGLKNSGENLVILLPSKVLYNNLHLMKDKVADLSLSYHSALWTSVLANETTNLGSHYWMIHTKEVLHFISLTDKMNVKP
jgi:hypothetical protein